MSITDAQAKELARLLPDGLSCDDSRQRLLCIVEILRLLTDRDHALSNADLRAILRARFGEQTAPAENTIGADLRAIRDSGCLGLDVNITPSGAWCESRTLEPGKVRMLLNAVQASRFLTEEQSGQLQESLFNLVSCYQELDLEGQVLVEQRARKSNQTVFDTCDTIARAIRLGRKVEFGYTFSDFNGKSVLLESDAGETLRVETPIALLFSSDNYYLETYAQVPWRHGSQLMRSRVDRMVNVRVSDHPADENKDVRKARSSAARRLRESFSMVDGTSRIIFLRVRANCTNVMLDRFGYGLKYAHFKGELGDVNTTALTCVRVAESFAFFRWLSAAGDDIVISKPVSELQMRSGPWGGMLKGVDYATVKADYKAMVKGYLAYLDKARSAYVK